jgi:hypothetical protein
MGTELPLYAIFVGNPFPRSPARLVGAVAFERMPCEEKKYSRINYRHNRCVTVRVRHMDRGGAETSPYESLIVAAAN